MDNRDRTSGDDRMDLDDPLGIAREPVTKDDRIRASSDDDSARRRRRRALGEDVEESSMGLGDLDDDPQGATGIDMGGAGKGTGIKRTLGGGCYSKVFFGLRFPARIRFRKRMLRGVTSTSSSSLMNSIACSRLSWRGGISRIASSAVEARMLVCFFSFVTFTSMSF